MRVPDRVTAGFGRGASAYQRGRPSYPRELLEAIGRLHHLGPGVRALDLAAGTGKFTALLVESGAEVVAIELVPSMLAELAFALPEVRAVDAEAHALPLAAASMDLVTVATAFHWFADEEAVAELARVIRPGGLFAIVSNRRDTDDPLAAALEVVLAKRRPIEETVPSSALLVGSGYFTEAGEGAVAHVHDLSREQFFDLALSMSYIAPVEATRAEVVAEVEQIAPRSGSIPLGYRAIAALYRRC